MTTAANTTSHHHSTGALAFLNPTKRYHPFLASPSPPGQETETAHHEGIYHVWRSRDNRKGRHAAVITPAALEKAGRGLLPRGATNSFSHTWRGMVRMGTRYPVWDVSYDVATIFTLGSVVWVINGFFVWLPLAAPWTAFPGESTSGGGWTAFVGATIFEIGSVLLMVEAVNENQTECFGWALEEAFEDHGLLHLHANPEGCYHHHRDKQRLVRQAHPAKTTPPLPNKPSSTPPNTLSKQQRHWSWLPTPHELTAHYLRDLGFLACLSQFLGATVFWVSGFTALPPLYAALSDPAVTGAYWLPQVAGGTGFIVSSALFMLEVQDRWYRPALRLLGWHIGFWNLVGSVGFTLCGGLGFGIAGVGVEYAATLATFVGSWAFLIGSVIQWYESLDKYPVSVEDVHLPHPLPDAAA
ncbi:hypothetical protein B0T25DRAFT_515627 [Lasiosphaeria hispida]|uniref:Integral membrane protein n=1 Tax=Lasiosphaeria hispida TaxID=260671 RepID=A0AAJ0HSD4_9PEZI|nr:hypothetical protein B0T25DRAFT_515627 [Lasiosphaeria hispida]